MMKLFSRSGRRHRPRARSLTQMNAPRPALICGTWICHRGLSTRAASERHTCARDERLSFARTGLKLVNAEHHPQLRLRIGVAHVGRDANSRTEKRNCAGKAWKDRKSGVSGKG